MEAIKVLDHGFVRLVEAWGTGYAGKGVQEVYDGWNKSPDFECGIIEAARQSTQGAFKGWEDIDPCPECKGGEYPKRVPVVNSDDFVVVECPRCRGKKVAPGDKKLLKFMFDNKHATPFEFSGMVIEVRAPIFVFREWHRHRTQSYNEMSARYAPLPDLDYTPTWDNLLERGEAGSTTKNRQASGEYPFNREEAERWWHDLDDVSKLLEGFYQRGLKAGVPKELARIRMPVGRYSQMRASANLRNWLAFLTLRSDPQAQWEIRQYAEAVGKIISETFPRTWELFRQPHQKGS